MLETLQQILAALGFRGDIGSFLVLFGLVMARMTAAIALSPFLGGRAAAGTIKLGLALVISMLLFPSVRPAGSLGEMSTLLWMCLLIKEVVIGATIGFLSQIVFQSVQMAGAMIDYGRGMSQATFFAPQLETNVSLIGQLQFQAALVLFLLLNGHLLFLRALASSFENVPLLKFPQIAGGSLAAIEQMARYSGRSLAIAVELSAPVLLALFLVDVSFAMLGKVASGFNVHNQSQPVKAMFGLGVVLLALGYTLSRMPDYFAGMLQELQLFMRHIQ